MEREAVSSSHSASSPLTQLQNLSSLPEEEQGKSITTKEGIWKAREPAPQLSRRPSTALLASSGVPKPRPVSSYGARTVWPWCLR